jgi:hypothetical protein
VVGAAEVLVTTVDGFSTVEVVPRLVVDVLGGASLDDVDVVFGVGVGATTVFDVEEDEG